ncbi:MAG: lamin tail domain-containing protein [bacterium]
MKKFLLLMLIIALTVTVFPADINLNGWQLKQFNSTQTYTFGDITVPGGSYVIVCRGRKKADFEAYYGVTLGSNVIFLDSVAVMPQINGAETYSLYDSTAAKIDTTYISLTTGGIYYRDSTNTNTFTRIVFATTSATPGSLGSTVANKGKGMIITEVVDAAVYQCEYVELYNDTGTGGAPTNTPPSINSLSHTPSTVTPATSVTATANITDGSAVLADTLFYQIDGGAWTKMTHTSFSGSDYSYSMGLFSADNVVNYYVKAVDDSSASTLSDTNSFTVITPVTVVINEFCSNGDAATDDDGEWIELYNYGTSSVDISGFVLSDNPAANGGTEGSFIIPPSTILPAKSFYLCVNNITAFSAMYPSTPDIEYGAIDAGMVLANTGDDIYLFNADSMTIDIVYYGSVGTNPVTAPAESLSAVRSPDGQDTDVCSADFAVGASIMPTPGWGSSGTSITNITRSPFLPYAEQPDTIRAKVIDSDGLKLVRLITSAYDSTDIDTYNMNAYSGDSLYQYVLPGRGNDCRFEYYVEALDSNDDIAKSSSGKFFWGYTSIPRYKENTADGYAKWIGYNVRATGIVTVGTGAFNSTQNIINFQQNYILGAVWKNDSIKTDGSETVITGDSVEVQGTIIFSVGQTRIGNPYSALTKFTSGHAIDTILLNADHLMDTIGDTYEGLLVQINARARKSATWPMADSSALVVMYDTVLPTKGSNSDTFLIWIDPDTDIDGSVEPTWPKKIIGVVTQYDISSPYWSMYEIYPRAFADISTDLAIQDFYLTAGIENGFVSLKWSIVGMDDISSFRIERKYEGEEYFKILATVNSTTFSYKDNSYDTKRNAEYKVVCITSNGRALEYSSIKVTGSMFIREFSMSADQNTIKESGWITLSSPSEKSTDIKLYNLDGRAVKTLYKGHLSYGKTNLLIKTDELPSGIYIVKDASGAFKNVLRLNIIK